MSEKLSFGPKMTAMIADARRVYTDAIAAATSQDETSDAFLAYTRAIAKVVDLVAADGDNALSVARRKYLDKAATATTRNEVTDIRRAYEHEVTGIIMANLKKDEAPAPKPEPVVVVKTDDATLAPVPAPIVQPAQQVHDVVRRVEPDVKPTPVQRVVSVEHVPDKHVLDKKPAPVVTPPAPLPMPVSDAQARYDARVRDAWRTPPPQPFKRRQVPLNVFQK